MRGGGGREFYEFAWPGKKASILESNASITKTLRPSVEDSKNWESTKNLYIEGDNLEVLKILREGYLGKVKMIYIDPPSFEYACSKSWIQPFALSVSNLSVVLF